MRQRGETSSESNENSGDTRTEPTRPYHWAGMHDINAHLKQMPRPIPAPIPAVRNPVPAVRNKLGSSPIGMRMVTPAVKDSSARPENGIVSEGNILRPKPRNERLNTLPRSRDLPQPSHTPHTVKTWAPPASGTSDGREKGERRPTIKKPVPAPRSLSLPSLPNSTERFTVKPKHPPKPYGGSVVKVDVCDRAEVNQDRVGFKGGLRDVTSNPSLANDVQENEVQPSMPPVPTRRRSNKAYMLDRQEGDLQEGLAIVTEEDSRTHSKEKTRVYWNRNQNQNKAVETHPDLVQLLSQLQECAANNDYYSLFGVEPTATMADLAKARREKSRELHPDHFGGDHEQRTR